MGSSALSWAISPPSHRGPDENLPTASTPGAFQHVTCHQCTHHRQLIQNSGWGNDVLLVWKHGVHVGSGSRTLKYGACHGPTQHLHFALQPDWTTPPPLTRLHHYIFVCFKGFMVDVKAWAGCICSLTQLVCTPATPLIA
jgi:hypothetical protein